MYTIIMQNFAIEYRGEKIEENVKQRMKYIATFELAFTLKPDISLAFTPW